MYTQYSKFDGEIYEYSLKHLTTLAKSLDAVSYIGVISNDEIPILFTAEHHVCRRYEERLGCSYITPIVEKIIRLTENNLELGQLLLDMMDSYDGTKRTQVALWDEAEDIFYYLHPYGEYILIGTLVWSKPVYFVNPDVDCAIWVKSNGDIVTGIPNIPKFRLSDGRNFKK